jgi:hypothetical protein
VSDSDIERANGGIDRRSFVKKLAVGAFAVPVVVSFQLDDLARAGTFHKKPPKDPGHSYPNQTEPNQPCEPPKHHRPPKPPEPPPKPPKHHDPPKPPKHHDPKPPKHHDPPKPPKPPKSKKPKHHKPKPKKK